MRFLVDAQLPARLARLPSNAGYDAPHTVGGRHGNISNSALLAFLAGTLP